MRWVSGCDGQGACTGRASDGECAESYGRAAASPCDPSPAPALSTASPPGGALPRVACEMRRTRSVALVVAGVISGRTSASGLPYVPSSRRLIRSPGRFRAEGCGWDGRGVVSTVRGGQSTAEGKELQLEGTASSSSCPRGARDVVESCWGRASGGPAAEYIGARPSTRAALHVTWCRAAGGIACFRSAGGEGKRLCRVRDAAAACGGSAAEDIGAPPKNKGRLARAIGCLASRVYLLRRVSARSA